MKYIDKNFNNYNRLLLLLLKSTNFFQPNDNLGNKYHVINDITKADALYTTDDPVYELGEEGKNYDVYCDLFNERSFFAYTNHLEFDTPEELTKFNQFFNESVDVFWKMLDNLQEKNSYLPERFIDYIGGDFETFSAYLTFGLTKDSLVEQQLEAYADGCMPCSWYGKYPSGKLAVYVPNGKSPLT